MSDTVQTIHTASGLKLGPEQREETRRELEERERDRVNGEWMQTEWLWHTRRTRRTGWRQTGDFGAELAPLLRATAFSTVDVLGCCSGPLVARGFHEGSHERERLPHLRGLDAFAHVPPRASSHVRCDAGPLRAWRPPASEACSAEPHV